MAGKNPPFSGDHFADFCESMVGQPYWYGTALYPCTRSLLARKRKQYPAHYASSRQSGYEKDVGKKSICADCVGGIKGYCWTGGGVGVLESLGTGKPFENRYASHGCPDRSANGMFSYSKSKGMAWGEISTLPNLRGLALHRDGHMGFTVGDGYAVEWRGFRYGCVKTKIARRDWTHWCKLPFLTYPASEPPPQEEFALGARLLRRGMRGKDVVLLQQALLDLQYSLPRFGADGDFGGETEQTLIRFQKARRLSPDGVYGESTHIALMAALGDQSAASGQDEPAETPKKRLLRVVSQGGTVNLRAGNGTQYPRTGTAFPGMEMEWIATAENSWHAALTGGKVVWISGKYAARIKT